MRHTSTRTQAALFALLLGIAASPAAGQQQANHATVPGALQGLGTAMEDEPGLIHPASSLPAPSQSRVYPSRSAHAKPSPAAVHTPAHAPAQAAKSSSAAKREPVAQPGRIHSTYNRVQPASAEAPRGDEHAYSAEWSVTQASAVEDLPDDETMLAPDELEALADDLAENQGLALADDKQAKPDAKQDAAGNKGKDEKPKEEKKDEKKEEDQGAVVGSSLDLKPVWTHNGFELQSKNKDFKIHVGGRTQVDATFFDADNSVQYGAGGTGTIGDSINMRRARLRVDGTFYEVIDWAAEYDFVNTASVATAADGVLPFPVPTDLWVTVTHLPVVGNFRMGNIKDPISFEHLMSSRFLDFLERSPGFDAIYGRFNNGFVPGAMFFNWNEEERMTWALGVFKHNTNPFGFGVGGGEYNLEGRLTALPYLDADGRYLAHMGISGRHADLDQQQIRFLSRGSIRNGPPGPLNAVMANTGFIAGDTEDIVNVELASVWGPWQLLSEYSAAFVTNATFPNVAGTFRGNVFFQQTYVEVLYFLTGEHRAYNRKTGVFDRIVPHENFFLVKDECGRGIFGRGAWQVGARYAFLDLNDSGITGGQLHDVTFGLNWFLNPNMKVQWNYNWTRRDAAGATSDGDVHGLGMRMAMDF